MIDRSPTAMAVLLALASGGALAAPPAGSAYFTDPQQSQVQDATSQSIGQVNMITCVVSSMRPDALVNQGPYNALIDQNVCNAAKSGPASGSSAGATQAPNYMTAVVNSTRASNSDPMIASAWISINQQGTPVTVYAHITATEAPSASNPYGAFRLDYCGKSAASTSCLMNGYMQAGNGQLSYYETDQGGGGGGNQTTALALSSIGTSSGSGSINVAQSQNGQSQTQSFDFAYDASYFYRADGSSGAECFSRDASDPATLFSVGQYGLYDATSGNELELNSGFPIQYTVSGQNYQGYVGYYGLSTQPGAPAPATDTTVKKVDYQNGAATTASYTLVTNGGVLTRFTRESTTLKLIDQIQLQVFINDPTGSGLADQNTTYLMNWDEASQQFVATGEMQCAANGCQTGPLSNSSTPIAISPSFWSVSGLQGWSPSLGGGNVFIALNNPGQPLDATVVTYYQQDLVYPDDAGLPSALYCVSNCPTAATLQAFLGQSGNSVTSPFVTATFNAWQPTTTPVAYALSGNVLVGGDGSSTPVIDSNAAAYQSQPQFGNGVMSGHLVANLADAQCGTDPNTSAPQYCDWTIMSSAAVYYQWQTGPNSWNRFTAVKDASNAFVHFDPPMQVTFNVPANTTGSVPYGNYAGTTMILQYGGFGNLWGIPGTCVSSVTNQPLACNDPSGNALYVSAFQIPFDATQGLVTASANGVKTPYLVKWLDRQILLAQKPASTCTGAGLTTSPATLPGASGLEDPSDPSSSVYNGVQPTVSSAPRVIQGEVMY